MKILKKLLPVLLAAVLLTGAIAAFSACAPIEPNIPPEEEEPGGGVGIEDIPMGAFLNQFVYQDRIYLLDWALESDDVGFIDQLIGMWINAEDYEEYKAQYPDMEFVVDTNNSLFNRKHNNTFYLYSAKNYPIEQCIILQANKFNHVVGVFTSNLFVEQ